MNNLPVAPSTSQDFNLLVEQAQTLAANMQSNNIKKIEFENGPYAEHDRNTGTTIIAGSGAIVEDTPLMTTVHVVKPGVDSKAAVIALTEKGQKQVVVAAAQGTSQPTVSILLSND